MPDPNIPETKFTDIIREVSRRTGYSYLDCKSLIHHYVEWIHSIISKGCHVNIHQVLIIGNTFQALRKFDKRFEKHHESTTNHK